jgi:hypothetical protein
VTASTKSKEIFTSCSFWSSLTSFSKAEGCRAVLGDEASTDVCEGHHPLYSKRTLIARILGVFRLGALLMTLKAVRHSEQLESGSDCQANSGTRDDSSGPASQKHGPQDDGRSQTSKTSKQATCENGGSVDLHRGMPQDPAAARLTEDHQDRHEEDRNPVIWKLQRELREPNKSNAELNAMCTHLRNQRDQQKQLVSERDIQLSSANKYIEQLENQYSRLAGKYKAKNEEVRSAVDKLQQKRIQIEEFRNDFRKEGLKQEERITELEARNTELIKQLFGVRGRAELVTHDQMRALVDKWNGHGVSWCPAAFSYLDVANPEIHKKWDPRDLTLLKSHGTEVFYYLVQAKVFESICRRVFDEFLVGLDPAICEAVSKLRSIITATVKGNSGKSSIRILRFRGTHEGCPRCFEQ